MRTMRARVEASPRRPRAVRAALFGGAVLLAAGFVPAWAEDQAAKDARPDVVWILRAPVGGLPPQGSGASRFYNDHLMPRFNRQFERLEGVWLDPRDGAAVDDLAYSVYSDAARRGAERATRRALTDYLTEETSLARVLERFSSTPKAQVKGGTRKAGSVRWDAGISHSMPVVDMRYDLGGPGDAEMKLRLGLLGAVRLELRLGRLSHARFSAGYDPEDDEFRLGANLTF